MDAALSERGPIRPAGRAFLNRIRFLGTVLALVVLTTPLAANGVQESRMAQARQLIAEKNYTDAIALLTQVVREEPDRQDEAQDLINEVIRLQNQFNKEYESVITMLYEKDDVDGALQALDALTALDANPNKLTKDTLAQARRSARIIAANKRYNDIMARALAALGRREYGNAVQIYLEGSDLAKNMFLEEDYGSVFVDQVERSWTDLRAAAALFVQAEARLKTLPNQGLSLLASGGSLEPVLAPLRDMAAWRQRIWSDGQFFSTQNQVITKGGRQQDFYLLYSSLFVNGPPDAKTPEGFLGAFDRLWLEALDPWTERVRTLVASTYASAKSSLDQARYPEAKTGFDALRVQARQGLDIVSLWNRVAGVDAGGTLDPRYRARLTQILPLGVWLEHRAVLGGQGSAAAQDLPRAATLASSTLDRAGLESARADVRQQKVLFAGFAQTATLWTRTGGLTTEGFSLLDAPSFATDWQTTWTQYRQRALAQEAVFVDKRGALDYGLLDGRFQGLQTQLTGARDQVEGTVRYPLQAAAKLTELRPNQDALARDIGSFVTLYDGETADVKTPAVVQWPVRGRDLLTRLTAAQTLQGQLLLTAQANYQQSQSLKKQGQDLATSVTAAAEAENFAKARSDLQAMTTRFADSLRLQEDAAFRAESDAQAKTLSDLILKALNTVIIREVRVMIQQGSDAYLAQQFRQASQVLTNARKRWSETHADTDRNSEVEYWLGLTNFALSVTTGRELSPIDPLYTEVQQLLNFARRDFNAGKDKLDAGEKEEGLALMNQATSTIGKILLTAPQNQEAGLLKLEILKTSDPDNFPALFKVQFDAAFAKIDGGNPQVAYTDLQDLDKIQPGYPGMADAIKKVRVKIGLDKPPVDPAVAALARTRLAQATRLVASGTQANLREARTLVAQVLAIDPKNLPAQTLADTISGRLVIEVAALNATQTGQLADIRGLLPQERYLEALAQINDFIAKNPAVANLDEVRELLRRIRASN